MQQQIQAFGLPWFHEDDYEAFRSVLPDRGWHRTFAEWEASAEQTYQRLKGDGARAFKAKVRSAEFVACCRAGGHDVNTKALNAYGADYAYRQLTSGDH